MEKHDCPDCRIYRRCNKCLMKENQCPNCYRKQQCYECVDKDLEQLREAVGLAFWAIIFDAVRFCFTLLWKLFNRTARGCISLFDVSNNKKSL
jgi:hypothetical protein